MRLHRVRLGVTPRAPGKTLAIALSLAVTTSSVIVACTAAPPSSQPSPRRSSGYSTPVPMGSPSPVGAPEYLQPFFFQTDGWHVWDGGRVVDGEPGVAWASTAPLDPRDVRLRTGFPWQTIDHLDASGIVLSVMTSPWFFKGLGPWPPGSWTVPDLGSAVVRGPQAEEPIRPLSVYEIDGPYALVRVYFGSPKPTTRDVERAQTELSLLQIPPACPEPRGPGALGATFSTSSGSPGSIVHVGGTIPYRRMDGGYAVGSAVIDIWWRPVGSGSWDSLPWSAPPSSVVSSTGVRWLGEGGKNACAFDVVWKVPNVDPGTYRINVLQVTEDRGGASSLQSVNFEVTD